MQLFNLDIKTKRKLYRVYAKIRNFIINNFFVNVVCIIQEDNFIYLSNNNLIYNYILLSIPFIFIKFIFYIFNYKLIYKVDGIYRITNNIDLHIIPFIKSCTVINNNSTLNITSDIYMYNSCVPLEFLINTCNINDYNLIKLNYVSKGNNIEKEINIKDINPKKYLIYNLFDEKTD